MNILYINTHDTLGGAAKVAQTLIEGLENRGHQTSMFVADKKSNSKKVKKLSHSKFAQTAAKLLATDLDFFQSSEILETPEYKKADLIHLHNIHGRYFSLSTFAQFVAEKPVIWTLHDMWAITAHCVHTSSKEVVNGFYNCPSLSTYSEISWHNEFYLTLRKRLLYKNSKFQVVVPSNWLQKKVDKSALKDHQIHLIHNGINTREFKPVLSKEKLRQKLHLPTNKKIVLILSNGIKENAWKGWLYAKSLISNFQNRTDVVFLLVGESGDNSANCIWVPYTDDTANYYAASDVFLLTSLHENFPLTVLEAMSANLPVVSFDVGGVSEAVVHGKNGYIAKYKSSPDLLTGLTTVLRSAKKYSFGNRSRVQKFFSDKVMLDNYLKVYKKAINEYK